MGILIGFGLLLALTGEVYAQRRGFGAQLPGMGRSSSVNPMPPAHLRPQIPPGGAGGRATLDSSGSGSGSGAVVPYVVPYPVYGGGAYPDAGPAPSESDSEVPNLPQPSLAAPQVQYYAVPRRPEPPPSENMASRPVAPACQDSGEKINPAQFFIALKNSWVYTALAYWVQGETLHYISSQGGHNMVSLDLVDREISAKLNRGARVEFALPKR